MPLDKGVYEVDAGKLHQGGEHGHEAEDDVGVHCCRVANLHIIDMFRVKH